MNTISPEK